MSGRNEICLNLATMMTALQHYFDTVLFVEGKSPEVRGVEYARENSTPVFRISVEAPKEPSEAVGANE